MTVDLDAAERLAQHYFFMPGHREIGATLLALVEQERADRQRIAELEDALGEAYDAVDNMARDVGLTIRVNRKIFAFPSAADSSRQT